MPAPYPQEFREDVVRVARSRKAGVTLAQIAKDFGVHEMTLHKWIRQADIDDGVTSGVSSAEAQRVRELEQEVRELRRANEVLKRAASFFGAELDRHYRK